MNRKTITPKIAVRRLKLFHITSILFFISITNSIIILHYFFSTQVPNTNIMIHNPSLKCCSRSCSIRQCLLYLVSTVSEVSDDMCREYLILLSSAITYALTGNRVSTLIHALYQSFSPSSFSLIKSIACAYASYYYPHFRYQCVIICSKAYNGISSTTCVPKLKSCALSIQ